MITFLTIAVAIGTIGLMLYFLSIYDSNRMDKIEAKRDKEQSKRTGEDPRKVFNEKWDKNIPRPRICPVCGAYLKKHEFLYASIREPIGNEIKKQAHIYGCRFCYLGLNSEDIKSFSATKPEETLDI